MIVDKALNSMPGKLSVGYIRCSTDMQEESPAQQIKEIEHWANEKEFKVIRWYIDKGKSGTTFLKRPKFVELIRDVEHNPDFQYVLVYDESRWGRPSNPRENSYWKIHFERFGVKVIIINSQSKQENDIGSYVVEVVESAEASEYSKKLARATRRGTFSNAEKGFYNGGTAPYGFIRVAVDKLSGEVRRNLGPGQRANRAEEKVKLAPGDPIEVNTVKRIFEMKVNGFGYRAIANQLNVDNIPCPKRGRWKNFNQRWSMNTIRTIIENPAYNGSIAYNRFPLTKKRIGEVDILGQQKIKRKASKGEMIIIENSHECIVTKDVWTKANTINSHSVNVSNHRFRESPFLLSGIMKCSHCGFNFQGTTQTKKYANPNWEESKTRYYNDGGYHAKGLSVCTPLRIKKDLIETFVVHSIKEYIAQSNIGHTALKKLEEMLEGDELRISERDRVMVGLNENAKKMNNLINLVESGAKLESVIQRIKELERERDLLQEHLHIIEKSIPTKADLKMMAEEIARIVVNFQNEFYNSTLAQQKQLLRRFVAGVMVYREDKARAQCYIRKIPLTSPSMGSSLPCVAGAGLEPAAFGL